MKRLAATNPMIGKIFYHRLFESWSYPFDLSIFDLSSDAMGTNHRGEGDGWEERRGNVSNLTTTNLQIQGMMINKLDRRI